MRCIKTNLFKNTFFVLTDDNDRNIGIINVPEKEFDISEKVLTAIKDDSNAEYAILITDVHIESLTNIISFDVEIQEELGDEPFTTTFYLEPTDVY